MTIQVTEGTPEGEEIYSLPCLVKVKDGVATVTFDDAGYFVCKTQTEGRFAIVCNKSKRERILASR